MKLSIVTVLLAGVTISMNAATAEDKTPPALNFKLSSLEGKEVDLAKYKGKVLVVVNVASKCGATPQYEQLQGLYEKYGEQGLAVLGVPCNQFGKQEPGTAEEIREFCTNKYSVTFDMFSKVDVKGPEAAPLYEYLTSKDASPQDPGPVKWNFEKFVIGKDGKVAGRFRTGVSPDDPKMVELIESELKK